MGKRHGQGFGWKEDRAGNSNTESNDKLIKVAKIVLWAGLAVLGATILILTATGDIVLR